MTTTTRRPIRLQHEFIEHAPESLEPDVLYVSIRFATVLHLCCCGCGREVVTPLSPVGWQMWFDGESVSLQPSIGNWSFPCQSHYFIRRNQVQWALRWSAEEIAAGRAFDRDQSDAYFESLPELTPQPFTLPGVSALPTDQRENAWRSRLRHMLERLRR